MAVIEDEGIQLREHEMTLQAISF